MSNGWRHFRVEEISFWQSRDDIGNRIRGPRPIIYLLYLVFVVREKKRKLFSRISFFGGRIVVCIRPANLPSSKGLVVEREHGQILDLVAVVLFLDHTPPYGEGWNVILQLESN